LAKVFNFWHEITNSISIIYSTYGNNGEVKSMLSSPINSANTQKRVSFDRKRLLYLPTSECSIEKKSHPEKEMEAKITYLNSFTVK